EVLSFNPLFSIGNLKIAPIDVLTVTLAAAVILLLERLLQSTRLGVQMRAVADGPLLAGQVRISVHAISAIAWAIAGLSAGAYGAINIGLHQVAALGLIQVWSGYFIETRTGVFAHATRSGLRYNSPLDYVRTMKAELRQYPLRVFLYVGDGDSDRFQIYPMDRALRDVGAKVQYAIYPGGHSWGLWSPRTDQMLIMASHDFAARCPAPAVTPAPAPAPATGAT
ncbi:MAG TPA: alpha/beta hydrolase-fold protein, partial [Solirubrobacteraceae bacterium]|nr:alpha/beta hydrolase-fold protein [Solirubrobacteraceae bacterium]